jgi:HlyD family secretion protein
MKQSALIAVLVLAAGAIAAFLIFAPRFQARPVLSGYVEGEPLYPAAPVAGRLTDLKVKRGDVVKQGDTLFAVDPAQIAAQRAEAASQLAAQKALAAGARRGQRPQELAQIHADLVAVRAVATEAQKVYDRTKPLFDAGAASKAALDSAISARDRANAQVQAVERRLQVAQLGQRTENVANADERVRQAQSNLEALDARLTDLSPPAPAGGRIEDVFYQPGEWVPANQPVLSLIPDDRVRIRFFVPQADLSRYTVGTDIDFTCDGCQSRKAKITYISPRPEFTPPVIYAREARDRMVFLVEATPADAKGLTPGQPIDITPLSASK